MNDDLQKRIQAALANPQNMGEMAGADSIGTVGNADCGEMLRLWVKFKQQDGKRVIDRATFQSFGCETAIAVASLATELIRGKTAEEALALKTEELAGELEVLSEFLGDDQAVLQCVLPQQALLCRNGVALLLLVLAADASVNHGRMATPRGRPGIALDVCCLLHFTSYASAVSRPWGSCPATS